MPRSVCDDIVPTGVGVNRSLMEVLPDIADCPHGRGGEPPVIVYTGYETLLSPRAWG